MLWHQRLGHPSDDYLYNAHRFVDGVPRFKHEHPILDNCPTCIQAKQTKSSATDEPTITAKQPYQGLSVDFMFSGTKSKDTNRRKHFVGINGETSALVLMDHFTRHIVGESRLSKAPPVEFLRHFLEQRSPNCDDKYVVMDQGGELYKSPAVQKLFEQYGYTIHPTGADTSRQNAVERHQRTIANGIRSLLIGSGLPAKFWPYAFHHYVHLKNAIIVPRKQQTSPTEAALGKKDNLSSLRTFGCRIWVRPPGRLTSKFTSRSLKGIFLGYLPNTTKNVVWYDVNTKKIKYASHVRFDEGMNDLPVADIPPNVHHLQ